MADPTGARQVQTIAREWSTGACSTGVALVRLLLASENDAVQARRALEALRDATDSDGAASALLDALDRSARGASAAARLLERARRDLDDAPAPTRVSRTREFFDWAVDEAGPLAVATYALADDAALSRATSEIVDLLSARGLLGPSRDVLDLGCGTGRLTAALAPRCASVTGIDLSPRMIAHARRACDGNANVLLLEADGGGLRALAAGAFDLVLAVDVFPYLVQQGTAREHVAEAKRVLRRGGDLVVFHYSYRADDALDTRELRASCRAVGLDLIAAAERPMTTWDGVLYHARSPLRLGVR